MTKLTTEDKALSKAIEAFDEYHLDILDEKERAEHDAIDTYKDTPIGQKRLETELKTIWSAYTEKRVKAFRIFIATYQQVIAEAWALEDKP